MEENLNLRRVCQNEAVERKTKFKYSISNILKNLYDAYNSSKITAKEKLEIKNLIFSKNSAVTSILEELKNPNLFDNHIKTLKRIVKTKSKTEGKTASKKFKLPSLNILCLNESSKKLKKFFEESSSREGLNQSLLMDSNESIIFIEKTNQNLFSEEEDENLSTTLGLELFNLSTNPSTPLNARKIKKNTNENKHQPVSRFKNEKNESNIIPKHEKNTSKTSNNIIKIEDVAKKILDDNKY